MLLYNSTLYKIALLLYELLRNTNYQNSRPYFIEITQWIQVICLDVFRFHIHSDLSRAHLEHRIYGIELS